MRRSPDPALKALTRALIDGVGNLDAAAHATGVGKSAMAGYQHLHDPSHMPVDVAARLEAMVGTPLLTAEMARRQGYALVQVTPADGGQLGRSVAELVREAAEVSATFIAAVEDGRVDAAEEDQIERELLDVRRKVEAALAAVAALRAQRGRS